MYIAYAPAHSYLYRARRLRRNATVPCTTTDMQYVMIYGQAARTHDISIINMERLCGIAGVQTIHWILQPLACMNVLHACSVSIVMSWAAISVTQRGQ